MIAIVPVGVIPLDVVGEVMTTVATNLLTTTVLAPGIALAPPAFDERRSADPVVPQG